ncbi:Rap family tetratricopeptide repeat protein [Bacillus rugosus]|uniref:response regulator aspartate phosphatase n=1 Tax=Bacillus TaxID=1386 RepID=UPI00142174CA|nr:MULTISPECIES: tetratricopeptide repeat protein [Bacillus]MEC1406943.1 tetratricopeptide repeat protein [Bacillus halotolerans]NUF05652.1 tetratricopeptide repeat protein [Bacillus rugosus]WHY22709.1 tetratricopeptide repeat protein [Bacillus halotolerans]
MKTEKAIPYDLVATKMNHWYVAIKKNWVGRAEEMRKEVMQEIKIMEENQDVLLYYSLLEFRHKLMLAYMYPNAIKDIEKNYGELKEYAGHENLTGMLEYYYYFFMGMFYFRQKELTFSLNHYRQAEKHLDSIDSEDIEVEKAEFYFKLSEVYYHMKQTYFSMNYAMRAYNIFKKQPDVDGNSTYGVQKVRCQFVIFGNLLDSMKFDEALKRAYKAYQEAEELNKNEKNRGHLIRSALFNIGLCYNQMEELDKAFFHFNKSLQIIEPENHDYAAKTLFVISFLKGRQNDTKNAQAFYEQSKQIAEQYNNEVVIEKLKMVKGLFLDSDLNLVREAFQFFRERGMYPDMESYGVVIADFLTAKKEAWGAIEFYRLANEARRQIKRGEAI